MNDETFISIGTKGTDIPKQLRRIEPPLVIGINRLRWAGRGKTEQAVLAHGWVSKLNEAFEVYPLEQAIFENRVVRVPSIKWTAEADGSIHEGEAFFRCPWQPGQPQPMMVAVRSTTWRPGCVGRSTREMNGSGSVARFHWDGMSATANSALANTHRRANQPWTREDRLVVLNIYCKLPPGPVSERQTLIQQVAAKLQRVPNAIVLKVLDFASLDLETHLQGHPEMQKPSREDEKLWREFNHDRENVALESEQTVRRVFAVPDAASMHVTATGVDWQPDRAYRTPEGETESVASVKVRLRQDFFRQIVLSNYKGRCGVTGIAIPELLIASHIVRWADAPEHRLDVRNGICLSRLHDGAFDAGLITFDEELRLVLSPALKHFPPDEALDASFTAHEGKPLRLSRGAVPPDQRFLAIHRETVFRR